MADELMCNDCDTRQAVFVRNSGLDALCEHCVSEYIVDERNKILGHAMGNEAEWALLTFAAEALAWYSAEARKQEAALVRARKEISILREENKGLQDSVLHWRAEAFLTGTD